jgi:hypothetical protein
MYTVWRVCRISRISRRIRKTNSEIKYAANKGLGCFLPKPEEEFCDLVPICDGAEFKNKLMGVMVYF